MSRTTAVFAPVTALALVAGLLSLGSDGARGVTLETLLATANTSQQSGVVSTCSAGPEYYQIDLVSTRKLPGTYGARGVVDVQFARSPFGVALSPEGEYVYDLRFVVENIRQPAQGQYVAWLSTPNLDRVVHVGPLGDDLEITGQVSFNKYLVIVSVEPSDYSPERWSGPIALRGLSKSGLMHTSIGHGLFEDEPCTQYGFN